MSPYRGGTPAPQFALHVLSTTLNSSTMSVGWTVTADLLAQVTTHEKAGEQSWMMLLVFSKGNRHEQRKIVPLRDCVAYLSLRRPGKTRVYGQILCGSKKEVFKTWLAKLRPALWENRSHYAIEEDGFPTNVKGLTEYCVGPEISVEVEAPREVFAPEPPAWEQKWVNRLFWRAPAFDQCDYRRRRVFAYTVQPLIAVTWTLWLALMQAIAFALFFVRPARWPWSEMGLSTEDPVGEAPSIARSGGLNFVLLPLFWWIPALGTWGIFRNNHGHYSLRGIVAIGAVSAPAIILFMGLNAYLAKKLVAHVNHDGVSRTMTSLGRFVLGSLATITEPFVKFGVRLFSTTLTDEDILVLTTPRQERAPMELADLPASKRTIKLRFFDLKAKVCRPFAR